MPTGAEVDITVSTVSGNVMRLEAIVSMCNCIYLFTLLLLPCTLFIV